MLYKVVGICGIILVAPLAIKDYYSSKEKKKKNTKK